jgi:3-oxoadipate enol-lactonase
LASESSIITGYANVGGAKLYYESTGGDQDAPPVVLIHAGFLDSRMWDDQFGYFSDEGFRVIRYDLRGSGRSDKLSPPSSQPSLAAKYDDANDLFELLEFLKIDKCHLVGLSNGGSVAINFALSHPNNLKCLVLVAPTVEGYEYSDANEEKLDHAMDAEWDRWKQALDANDFQSAIEIHLRILAPALSSEAKSRVVKIALDNYGIFKAPTEELRVKMDPPAFKRLKEINIPTLLVWGDRDYPGQISLAQRVHSIIPDSKRILIHGADHLVNISQSDTFNRGLLNFIRKQSR